MKKLFVVSYTAYVMAEDVEAAKYVHIDTDNSDIEVSQATSVDHIWWDAIPFGSDDDRTCGQIIQEEIGEGK